MARNVSSKVTINKAFIKKMDMAAEQALRDTADKLKKDIRKEQVIPRDKGELLGTKFFIDDTEISKGTIRLVHEGPYARRLYYHPEYNFHQEPWEETIDGKKVKHKGNPNAKGKWFEDWLPGGSKAHEVTETFEKFYKRHAGI